MFEMINLNLLGGTIIREANIETYKNKVNSTYEKYKEIIINENEKVKKNCIKKTREYIQNIGNYQNPENEKEKVSEEIFNLIEELNKFKKNKFIEYKKEFEEIKINISDKIKLIYSCDIYFDNEIYKNLFSMNHLFEHLYIVWFTIYLGIFTSFTAGGVGIALISHGILTFGNYIFDKLKKIDILIENMKKYEKNLEIKFDEEKKKIETILYKLKIGVEKEIESFVDSQNSEFKGIKNNKEFFDKLYSEFKKINHIK